MFGNKKTAFEKEIEKIKESIVRINTERFPLLENKTDDFFRLSENVKLIRKELESKLEEFKAIENRINETSKSMSKQYRDNRKFMLLIRNAIDDTVIDKRMKKYKPLTAKEEKVLSLLRRFKSRQEIAIALKLSKQRISNLVTAIGKKGYRTFYLPDMTVIDKTGMK